MVDLELESRRLPEFWFINEAGPAFGRAEAIAISDEEYRNPCALFDRKLTYQAAQLSMHMKFKD